MSDSSGVPAKKAPAKKAPAKKATAKKATAKKVTAKLRESSEALAQSAPTSTFFKRAQKRATSILQNPEQLKKLVTESSSKTSASSGPLAEVLVDLKTMIRLVGAYARGDYREISGDTVVFVVAALLYVVSPLDLIPDVIPVVGYLDDAAVVAWVIKRTHDELEAFRAWEARQGR